MLTDSKQAPFLLLTLAVILTFVVGKLVCSNMFIDGVLYTAVARNMANGKGSFWFPYFAKNWFSFFHEQPPLTLFFESLFFRICDTLATERIYSFLTFIINSWLIAKIWRVITPASQHSFWWLPVFAWITVPTVNWSMANCLEENTMSIFVLICILFQFQVIFQAKNYNYSVFAGFMLFLASMCKGFPGLFPLCFMALAWLYGFIKFRQAIIHTSLTLGVLLFCYLLLYIYPTAHESLGTYLNARVLNSIKNVGCQSTRHWIFWHLSLNILIQTAITAIIVFIGLLAKKQPNIPFKLAQMLLLLGLSGILPLMVTREQRPQYIVTAIPCFAFMLSVLVIPVFEIWWLRLTPKIIKISNALASVLVLASLVLVYQKWGKTYEHADKVNDYFIFQQHIPANSEVGIDSITWEDWDLQCNMNRLHDISFNRDTSSHLPFFIIDKTNKQLAAPHNYKKIQLSTHRYDLYHINE